MKKSPDLISKLWLECSERLDDIYGIYSAFLPEIVDVEQQSNDISTIVEFFRQMKDEVPAFFEDFDFDFCFDVSSFRLAIEAEYQGRIILMLLGMWLAFKTGNIYDSPVVRTAITTKSYFVLPRIIRYKTVDFLVISNHASLGLPFVLIDLLSNTQNEAAEKYFQKVMLRMYCENCVEEFIFKNPEVYFEPVVSSNIASQIQSECIDEIKQLDVLEDLKEPEVYSDAFWQDASYLSINFALSHELAHLLYKDHISGALRDEFKTDMLGLEILNHTEFYIGMLQNQLLRNHSNLSALSYILFLEAMHIQSNLENSLLNKNLYNLDEIVARKDNAWHQIAQSEPSLSDIVLQSFDKLHVFVEKQMNQFSKLEKQVKEIGNSILIRNKNKT